MKFLKKSVKVLLAGITALAILCVLMYGYKISPLRENNPKKNTDYVWQSNALWVGTTEGISFGFTDSQGFMNTEVIENPDIVAVGSSHTEASNVFQNENFCCLLDQKLDGAHRVYNMGISGHTFYKVAQYLPATLSVYEKVPKYVIVEADRTKLAAASVQDAVSGEVKKHSVNDSGIVAQLQKVPYFRAMYHQLDGGMKDMLFDKKVNGGEDDASKADTQIDEEPYREMFAYLQKIENEYHTKLILFSHPFEQLNEDGTISFPDEDSAAIFAKYAKEYGICFVNMQEDFEKLYNEEHHVPHGFVTGLIGSGHLNQYGHAAIAERLYQTIMDLEEK